MLNGNKAVSMVKEEYINQIKELRTSQKKADAGYDSCGCYWNFTDGDFSSDALIDCNYDGDRWEWRITEHEIEEGRML